MSLRHQGINSFRLNDSNNKREILFAKAWKDLNRLEPLFLERLLGRIPTQEEAEIAATVVQFLGTKQGTDFVENCLKKSRGLVKLT